MDQIPADQTVTYARIVVDYRAQKKYSNRVRITAGGQPNQVPIWTHHQNSRPHNIQYNVELSDIHPRRTICMRRRKKLLPMYSTRQKWIHENTHQADTQDFIDLYDLASKVKNRYIYMEISIGMYGLSQSGILAKKLLKMPIKTRIPWATTHSWTCPPWNTTRLVYTISGWLQYQVRWWIKRQAFIRSPKRILRNRRGLDRKFLLCNHPRLEIWKTIRGYRNAKLRLQAAPHIWRTTT